MSRSSAQAAGARPRPGLNAGPGPVAALVAEYTDYVRREHSSCWRCPVTRSGVAIGRSMLEWKATQGDPRPEHWTCRDIRAYLLGHLRTISVERALLLDAPTCAKDLVYFCLIAAPSRETAPTRSPTPPTRSSTGGRRPRLRRRRRGPTEPSADGPTARRPERRAGTTAGPDVRRRRDRTGDGGPLKLQPAET